MKELLLMSGVALLMAACNNNQQSETDNSNFGMSITADNTTSFEEVIAQMENQDTVPVKMTATVESVCQTKGCWMNLVSTDGSSEKEIFVKFKDYGFFVPKDISGKQVVLQGKAYKEFTSVDELRHYAEDEGKSEEEIMKITEPVEEYKFMADGVIVL